jgi:hypothetical protein
MESRMNIKIFTSAGHHPAAKPRTYKDQGFYSGFFALRQVAHRG